MKLDIVIPAHNEENVIADTIKGIEDKLDLVYRIIVVNDHSTDNTSGAVKSLMGRYSNLRLVENNIGRGFADALRKGFAVSDADLVVPVMADLCDDPQTIAEMYKKSLEGFDIVCGSRYMKAGRKQGGPMLQSFFSRFVGCSLKYLVGIPTHDASNSFKCYRRGVLNIQTQSSKFDISMEITLKAFFAGYKITEVPTVWQARYIGKSKFYLFRVAPGYIRLYLWALLNKR